MANLKTIICRQCGKAATTSQPKRVFCSKNCFSDYRYQNSPRKNNSEYYRKRMYGLTAARVMEIWQKQKGRCRICNKKMEFNALHIDHCHASGKVRGFLCRSCNSGLGMFRDSPWLLGRAIIYLESSGCHAH